jgi:hypothetical protein
MGAEDSNKQAQNGQKSETNFLPTRSRTLYAYVLTALKNCSQDTKDEFVEEVQALKMKEVDVEQFWEDFTGDEK